MYSAFKEG